MRKPFSSLVSVACTVLLSALGVSLSGCGDDSGVGSCTPGEERCSCASGGRCFTGLTCLSGVCVDPTNPPGMDASVVDGRVIRPGRDGGIEDAAPNPDAFFAMDPPPMMCLEDGTMGPPQMPPGGTPECPDDKNREGCACPNVGETAACWPGLRANRNRGICRDGQTTCERHTEFSGRWGPCVGFTLPVEGAEGGAQACECFSQGQWVIDNLAPCFITYSGTNSGTYAVSTDPATGQCPTLPPNSAPPPVPPSPTWSANRLTVDCEGRFELCYTIKAGDSENPAPTDCTVGRACTGSVWYEARDVMQELPALPSWSGADPACAARFQSVGGYGEMSVTGLSVECNAIDDGAGNEFVFNRVRYCASDCNMRPMDPDCQNCGNGGSGTF